MSKARYAIYYAPDPESPLWDFGSRWLGRDAATRKDVKRIDIKGVKSNKVEKATQGPRHYGFHATLKPPFRLTEDHDRSMLDEALEAFSMAQEPFEVPALELAQLDGFIALRPQEPCKALNDLAANCVKDFDQFRAAPSKKELEMRTAADLTMAQHKMLETWGYPYVMDEFRFHLTLTDRLLDQDRQDILKGLEDAMENILSTNPWTLDAITLMRQKKPDEPFYEVKRYPFTPHAKNRWPVKRKK
jgi:putative phosphonate metabolism protein